MKDFVQIWNSVANRRYSSVNTCDRELRELNRLKKSDIDNFESNNECDFNKFGDDFDFQDKKEAIINRLFERRKKGQFARQPKCLFVLLMLGFFAISAGCFILFVKPYDFFFNKKAVLSDGGEIFEMWRKPEVKLYIKIFLFNVTNAEEYLAGTDTKLKLKEVGPYVYREMLEHNVTTFNENGTLSAIPVHPLHWVDELSEGNKENDTLYLPHIALLSIANVVSQKDMFTRFGLNHVISLTNSQPLVKMTAREFMMGYESGLMTLGNTFLPGWIYFDKLGLIDRMYDFEGDFETVFTGTTNIRYSGLIDTYRGSTDLPQWKEKHCSNVQYASDGTKFPSSVEKNDTLLFYRKSLCRAAPLYATDVGVRNGLKGYKYTFPENMMDNGKYLEENKCFCRFGKCLPVGLIDVTDCYYGFPIALSYPHFYQGDEVLFSKVEGLNPDKEKHETAFWIQPESGLPLDVSTKFQINMALGDITSINNVEKFADMYLPLLWFDIRMYSLTPNLVQRFTLYLNILPIVVQSVMYAFFISGTILILSTVYILTFKIISRPNNFDWTKEQDAVYSPCEIPLSDTDTDNDLKEERCNSLLKTHGDKIKDLSSKLSDKMYDTVGSVKEKVFEEFNHVRNVFERRSSFKHPNPSSNDGFKNSDSDGEGYREVRQTDSDDDCRYLEVVDDDTEFISIQNYETDRSEQLNNLDTTKDSNYIVHISD